MIEGPFLVFMGDAPDTFAAKIGFGLRDWRAEDVVGQYRLPGCAADLGVVQLGMREAVGRGAKTLVIGAANRGGVLAPAWVDSIVAAIEAGMHVASGLHDILADIPAIADAARANDRRIHDVRVPRQAFPLGDGKRRPGKRCLTVGTDCSVGKMYVSLAVQRALCRRGVAATFRATGQTGILIEGHGIPLDAVVADFMSGAVEWLTPANRSAHWDIIEGQGSLFHPSYSGVTLSLIHGGQPDALILCHDPARRHMRGLPHYTLPSLAETRDLALNHARRVNPEAIMVGVALNTSAMHAKTADQYCHKVGEDMGLPCVDPMRHGAEPLAEALGTFT
jgi:uncharacterized NAD-dependent epimerase/dehydratase family protein